MSFIKKFIGKETSKGSNCCGIEIKEVEDKQEESCCESNEGESSCC